MRNIGAGLLLLFATSAMAAPAPANGDWSTYGHDKGAQRHSPLTQITPANVAGLKQAWVYHMKPPELEAAPDANAVRAAAEEGVAPPPPKPRFFTSEMTPLVVAGRMYISTPYGRIAALDAATGKELWATTYGPTGQLNRGVEYWPGDKTAAPRIVYGTGDGRLIELDAATGAFVQGFGDKGAVNMRTPEVMNGLPPATRLDMTSPPLVSGNLIVTGSRVQEQPVLGASGDVRAWDVRTGKLVWTFHTIPRPGEPNYGTWTGDQSDRRSGVNVWGFMSADEKRGLLYMPVAGATYDRYGGDRLGNTLYTASLVVLDLKTGKYRWHFQLVHHDTWDLDMQSAPLLFDAHIGKRTIPAVSVTNKSSMVFMFDRVTGKPLRPIVEKPVPQSEVAGEVSSPTQPFPATPPLGRVSFSYPADLADLTPALKTFCDNLFKSADTRSTVQYEPYHSDRPGVHYPGTEGGANWEGQSFDPRSGLVIVPVNNLGIVSQLVKNTEGPLPYRDVWKYFQQPDTRLQCVKPPWATLNAVDSRTGKIAWQVPLGVNDNLPEALSHTGQPGHGGAITTGSGLAFIGFSADARFRAFDVKTGKELWTYKLPASAHATPITYRGADGRQYVAVTSTGGSYVASPILSDVVTAFALPK